jgi:hypothetical protein
MLFGATSTEVAESVVSALVAASAFVEKGHSEKALATCGSNTLSARTANPNMTNCLLNLIDEQGMKVVLPSTKMA